MHYQISRELAKTRIKGKFNHHSTKTKKKRPTCIQLQQIYKAYYSYNKRLTKKYSELSTHLAFSDKL